MFQSEQRRADCANIFTVVRDGDLDSKTMTLDMIPRDVTARVAAVESTEGQGLRLMEMGVVPGARVRVVKSAPLGDPIQVCIRNYHLALRRAEAKSVTVVLE